MPCLGFLFSEKSDEILRRACEHRRPQMVIEHNQFWTLAHEHSSHCDGWQLKQDICFNEISNNTLWAVFLKILKRY